MSDEEELPGLSYLKYPDLTALKIIHDHVVGCTKCDLHKTRKQVVFGAGNSDKPDLAFIGEAPGADEDEQGVPFVGKSGQLLMKIIEAMGYPRDAVYIVNAASCRPPENRNPSNDELAACAPVWQSQLVAVAPRTIVCLGAVPTRAVLGSFEPVGRMRGKWFDWRGIPVRVTYHPSYLLRNPNAKADVWADMREVMKTLGKT